jgi:hypothetical protein
MDLKTVRKAAASATGLHGTFSKKSEETIGVPTQLSQEEDERKTQAILDRAVMAQRAASHQDEGARDRGSIQTRGGKGGRGGRGGRRGSTSFSLIPRMPDEIREARSKTPTRVHGPSPPRPDQSSTKPIPPPKPPQTRSLSPPPKPPRPPPKPVRPFEYQSQVVLDAPTVDAPETSLEAADDTQPTGSTKDTAADLVALRRIESAEFGRLLLADALSDEENGGTL